MLILEFNPNKVQKGHKNFLNIRLRSFCPSQVTKQDGQVKWPSQMAKKNGQFRFPSQMTIVPYIKWELYIKKGLQHFFNCFKSFGPDGIHPKLLKSLSGDCDFVDALVKLFSVCTDTTTLPSIWKSANLSALFKNGSKTDPLNYRPVSLTCVICKVFEKIVRSFIVDFVENNISKHQHGFVKGKSCF